MTPLSFDDAQMERLADAAAMLPQHRRDNFLRSVANVLGGASEPAQLEVAVTFVLNSYGVMAGRSFGSKRQRRKQRLRLVQT